MKELVAREIASRVKDGDVLGIGTGSTVDLALKEIGERIRGEGLTVSALTTSYQSAMSCGQFGICLLDPLSYEGELTWGFDGADEVDSKLRLIKGRGAAMLREKIVAERCRAFVVIIDDSKLVSRLGERCPVPVEVIPEALHSVKRRLLSFGATSIVLRDALPGKHGPVITEKGNVVLDVVLPSISEDAEREIKGIAGVVETGLFLTQASEVVVGGKDGIRVLTRS